MLKKMVWVGVLGLVASALAQAESCDQVCQLGSTLVKRSTPVDHMGIRLGEVSLSGHQLLVQALVYGDESDAAYREIMGNPQQNAASQRMTRDEVVKVVCSSPLYRDFLKAGGVVRHEIKLQRDGVIFYQNVMRECPNA
ncbi:hypothetical protein F3I62_19030 [Pseudomonas sp. R-28-1W-6]|uniref:hypothetical protein n=1 Tax=Pseudomonas sp. R-28-1W-6 TaxID=2650101 RepID=UPI0013654D38|nr:hypothetical protein [Pseudomonas sp. R-28-1W-6]MWV14200.1 hypothetical protein [Pseudomonas sp. R-28-1W-6]